MHTETHQLQVTEGGGRLDQFLAAHVAGLSRSAARRLIDSALVFVNGDPAKASYRVKTGDSVVAHTPAGGSPVPEAEPIQLNVVYEDDALLVVDKPAGMVVHPAPGHPSGTLVNALLAYHPELSETGSSRPGIVHRLDKDTSGLLLVAKSERAGRNLQRQFKERKVHKAYLGLLDGHVSPAWGRVEAPVGRDPRHRQRMAVLSGGREAVTDYHVLEQFAHSVGPAAGDYTLLEAEPVTGRTHQIRVHFASIGHPVVGDTTYGRRKAQLPLSRHFLHARKIGFRHPTTGQRVELEAELPQDLKAVLDLLRSP